jgi:dihydrofolate reductase
VRRIVVSMWTTLDGYVAGLQDEMDWLEVDDAMMAYEKSLVTAAEALLLGRRTHADFAGAWPKIARDDAEAPATRAYAQRVDDMPKIVVSRSGQTAGWDNTSRLDSLEQLGAVDEYHLLIHPTAIGEGKALFAAPTRLQLHAVETFPSGVTLMRYTTATD